MQSIMNFENSKIEILIENGKPLFEVYSTGAALGQTKIAKGVLYPRKDRINKNLKSAEIKPVVRCGQLYLNESQLYDLMLELKTEKVKPFRKWITSEVLPTIRKTGGYVDNSDLFINTYLPYADDNTKNLFRLQLQTIQQLNNKITEDKPLVDFANHIQASDDCIDMKAMAKLAAKNGVKIGRNRLFEFLRENKVLDKNNMPYQKYVENQPWFQVKEYTYAKGYDVGIGTITIITPKGQIGIVNMLKKHYQITT